MQHLRDLLLDTAHPAKMAVRWFALIASIAPFCMIVRLMVWRS